MSILFIFSPPVIFDLWAGNINAFVMLGFILPPQWGLFLVTLKPQIGGGISIYWLVDAWRKGRFKEVARVFLPVMSFFGFLSYIRLLAAFISQTFTIWGPLEYKLMVAIYYFWFDFDDFFIKAKKSQVSICCIAIFISLSGRLLLGGDRLCSNAASLGDFGCSGWLLGGNILREALVYLGRR
jgi:hypothetical protein